MIPTGGSDYHGTYKTDVLLGFGQPATFACRRGARGVEGGSLADGASDSSSAPRRREATSSTERLIIEPIRKPRHRRCRVRHRNSGTSARATNASTSFVS